MNSERSRLTTVNSSPALTRPPQTLAHRIRRRSTIIARWLHIYLSMVSFAIVLFYRRHPRRAPPRERHSHPRQTRHRRTPAQVCQGHRRGQRLPYRRHPDLRLLQRSRLHRRRIHRSHHRRLRSHRDPQRLPRRRQRSPPRPGLRPRLVRRHRRLRHSAHPRLAQRPRADPLPRPPTHLRPAGRRLRRGSLLPRLPRLHPLGTINRGKPQLQAIRIRNYVQIFERPHNPGRSVQLLHRVSPQHGQHS